MDVLPFPFVLFFAQYRKIFHIIKSYYTDTVEMVWNNNHIGLLQ